MFLLFCPPAPARPPRPPRPPLRFARRPLEEQRHQEGEESIGKFDRTFVVMEFQPRYHSRLDDSQDKLASNRWNLTNLNVTRRRKTNYFDGRTVSGLNRIAGRRNQ